MDFATVRMENDDKRILDLVAKLRDVPMTQLLHEMIIAYVVGHGLEKEVAHMVAFAELSDKEKALVSLWRGDFIEIIAQRVRESLS